jgi:hypothetical protein
MQRYLDYENNNIGYDFQYSEEDGGGIKCKNYELCECVLPKWWFECKGNYLCTNCHMMFGTWGSGENSHTGKGILEISNNIYCPICLKTKRGILYPRCNHKACIECFKRCMYGDNSGEPVFPYPDIEYEYYEDIENIKWKNKYPLIETYNINHNEWEDKNYENNKHLRLCPLCRA